MKVVTAIVSLLVSAALIAGVAVTAPNYWDTWTYAALPIFFLFIACLLYGVLRAMTLLALALLYTIRTWSDVLRRVRPDHHHGS